MRTPIKSPLHRPISRSIVVRALASVSKSVVVVGQGWAGELSVLPALDRSSVHGPSGFGAAKHLSEQGFDVTLLDSSPNPGGLATGWRTAQGKEVEAGMKGFWNQVMGTSR